jgi:glutathione S-transferase
MELWYTTTSPFARKVRICTAELGLADRLHLIEVDPWSDERLRRINPLAKVPTLVLGDGGVLFESALICEYLDATMGQHRLLPQEGPQRWRALLLQGLADGALTAVGRLFADERRAPHERAAQMLIRFAQTREAVLDRLEQEPLQEQPMLGEIAVASLLGYLDFRWPDRDWRARRPCLSGWFNSFTPRPSMTETKHQG